MIRDLPEDEVPDFWKQTLEKGVIASNRMTIKEIVLKVCMNLYQRSSFSLGYRR
jgi:hypothetical protein